MPTKVRSPISRKGSAVGSGQPMSPGARGNPGRRASADSVPEQEHQVASPVTAHNQEPARPLQETPRKEANKEPAPGLEPE